MKQPIIRHRDRAYQPEPFDEQRLRTSLSYACYSVGFPDGATDDIVTRAMTTVMSWLNNKSEVTDDDIRRKAGDTLERFCPEAGYLYKHQKSIL